MTRTVKEMETDDGLLVCWSCGRILGYVLTRNGGTERVYLINLLERHGAIPLCKHCRAVQWGCPAEKR